MVNYYRAASSPAGFRHSPMQPLHQITGVVRKGKNRGKSLGYPTTNIPLSQDIPEGVYVSLVRVGDKKYRAASFVGKAETFDEHDYQLESYILDFDRNIYGVEITVSLLHKLRGSKKFASARNLIAAIGRDVKQTVRFFS